MKKKIYLLGVLIILFSNTDIVMATEVNQNEHLELENINNGYEEKIKKNNANEIVNIPDKGLKRVINEHLGQSSTADISVYQIEKLTSISGNKDNITDISGLEYATNLKELHLNNNNITDITPLGVLKNLTILSASNNQISDITPISEMENLVTLNFVGNKINNVIGLRNLVNLKSLSLANNQIRDISSISNLTNLRALSLSNNQITNIEALSNLKSLEDLYLARNQLSDISPISQLTNLKILNLISNQISDISPTSSLVNLTLLSLSNNQISDISSVAKLREINALSLSNNQITNIEALNNLKNLEELFLVDNQINDISVLSGLNNLKGLWLDYNQIDDVSSIKSLINLEKVKIENQSIVHNQGNVVSGSLLTYNIKNISDPVHVLNLGNAMIGSNNIEEKWNLEINSIGTFSGTVNYTYNGTVDPEIHGTKNLTINLGENVDLLSGVTAKDREDGDLTEKILVDDSKVNYNEIGEYKVVYSVTDSDGNETKSIINLTIKKEETNELPVLNGTKDITINLGEKIDLLNGITAFDAEDGNLTAKLKLDDTAVDYNKTGEYEVVYSVMDSDGNMVEEIITLTIERNLISPVDPITPEVDPEKPEVVDPEKPEEVDPEKPEVVDPEKPEVVDPEKPEVVNPVNPTVPVNPPDPDKPEVVDSEKPEVVEPEKPEVVGEAKTKEKNKKLEDTGIKFSLSIFLIIIASLAIGVKVRKKYN